MKKALNLRSELSSAIYLLEKKLFFRFFLSSFFLSCFFLCFFLSHFQFLHCERRLDLRCEVFAQAITYNSDVTTLPDKIKRIIRFFLIFLFFFFFLKIILKSARTHPDECIGTQRMTTDWSQTRVAWKKFSMNFTHRDKNR